MVGGPSQGSRVRLVGSALDPATCCASRTWTPRAARAVSTSSSEAHRSSRSGTRASSCCSSARRGRGCRVARHSGRGASSTPRTLRGRACSRTLHSYTSSPPPTRRCGRSRARCCTRCRSSRSAAPGSIFWACGCCSASSSACSHRSARSLPATSTAVRRPRSRPSSASRHPSPCRTPVRRSLPATWTARPCQTASPGRPSRLLGCRHTHVCDARRLAGRRRTIPSPTSLRRRPLSSATRGCGRACRSRTSCASWPTSRERRTRIDWWRSSRNTPTRRTRCHSARSRACYSRPPTAPTRTSCT
mmetsp:Transcript_79776/g.193175  ORF Transcript_79776/g.193175 Transcript_79776/m.193175 type:complete len:303 (+) Transcript_79776:769-1677(+)